MPIHKVGNKWQWGSHGKKYSSRKGAEKQAAAAHAAGFHEETVVETLEKSAPASAWIHDFVHSTNPKFKGKSRKERIHMALGAYYGKQNEERALDEKRINEAYLDEAKKGAVNVFHVERNDSPVDGFALAKHHGATRSENIGGDSVIHYHNHTFPSLQHAHEFATNARAAGHEVHLNNHPKAAEGVWAPGKLGKL